VVSGEDGKGWQEIEQEPGLTMYNGTMANNAKLGIWFLG
jgi:hypothetical protein